MPRVHKTNARIAAGDPLAAWPIPQVPRFLHYSGGPAKGRLRSGGPDGGSGQGSFASFLKGPLPPSGHRIERGTIDLQSDINCLPERSLLGAFGKQHDDYDHDVFNSAGSTLATPHFGPENGVHLSRFRVLTLVDYFSRELAPHRAAIDPRRACCERARVIDERATPAVVVSDSSGIHGRTRDQWASAEQVAFHQPRKPQNGIGSFSTARSAKKMPRGRRSWLVESAMLDAVHEAIADIPVTPKVVNL